MGNIGDFNVKLIAVQVKSKYLMPKPNDFLGKNFQFDFTGNVKVRAADSEILTVININVRENEKPEELGGVSLIFAYQLENFNELVKKDPTEDLYIIPPNLEAQLRLISISTTRGFMLSHFQGTYLQNAVLPIVPIDFGTRQNRPEVVAE